MRFVSYFKKMINKASPITPSSKVTTRHRGAIACLAWVLPHRVKKGQMQGRGHNAIVTQSGAWAEVWSSYGSSKNSLKTPAHHRRQLTLTLRRPVAQHRQTVSTDTAPGDKFQFFSGHFLVLSTQNLFAVIEPNRN